MFTNTNRKISLLFLALLISVGQVHAAPNPPIVLLPNGELPQAGPLEDVFGKWATRQEFFWGNRMNDISTIDEGTNGGHEFETVLVDGYQWHSFNNETSIPGVEPNTMQFNVPPGQYLRVGSNLRYLFPTLLEPRNQDLVTIVWDFKLDPADYTGGKMFQIVGQNTSRIKFEFNPRYHDNTGSEPGDFHDPSDGVPYVLAPAIRAYSATSVGGGGEYEPIGCGTGRELRPQPAFAWRESDTPLGTYSAEHRKNLVLIKPGQWTRLIFTFDWRGGLSNQRVWGWLEAEDTPRTLWLHECGDSSQGFALGWEDIDNARYGLEGFWWEHNNSSSSTSIGHWILGRNLFVVLGVSGDQI